MSKKMYFMLYPEDFTIYDTVTREGKLQFAPAEQFDMEDEFYNRMIFEAKRKRIRGNISIREMVTGTKFKLKIIPRESRSNVARIYSNRLELRTTGDLTVREIAIPNEAAAGFFKEMSEDTELKEAYVNNVLQFFANARSKDYDYRRDIEGPNRDTIRSLRRMK